MTEIVILGLDVYFGTCSDEKAFARAVVHGLPCASSAEALCGQALTLRVANNALFSADVTRGERIAVVWAGETAAAADIATLWGFDGPVVDVADGPTVLLTARRLLDEGSVTGVLGGETNAVGGVALFLAHAERGRGRRVYATLEEVTALLPPGPPTLPPAHPLPGYWEWPSLLEGALPMATSAPAPLCALGSVRSNLGDNAPALAAVARMALCLHHRVIPATPGYPGPRAAQADAPFYVAPLPQPWLAESGARTAYGVLRRATQPPIGVLLHEASERFTRPLFYPHLAARSCHVFPLAADDRAGILALAQHLRRQADLGVPLADLAEETLTVYRAHAEARYALALLAGERAELLREIEFAIPGVEKAFAGGKDWTSPLGSSFTAHPQGQKGKVAFVYPGAFSSYVGMGRDLFQLFPHLHARLAEVTRYVSRVTAEKLLYPRRLTPASAADVQADEARLRADPTAMIESGASFAILYTAILRDVFGVEPQAALGYSLGEVSMLWALGVWPDGDAGSDAWNHSPLFKTRLAGPLSAVRESWGVGPEADGVRWGNYIVKAPPEQVRRAIERTSRVYLTMINTEKEVVIAGHPTACEQVIAALDCHALRLPFDAVIHAPPAHTEYAAFVKLYTLPTRAVSGIDFYSAAAYAPLPMEREALAHALATMTCSTVDFPRLVQAAYDAGARIFVELGPLGACSRWIGHILQERPHAVASINRSGKSDLESLLAVLAMLITQRVPVSLPAAQEVEATVRLKSLTQHAPPSPRFWPVRPTENDLRSAQYTAAGHLAFLNGRRESLQHTARLIAMQMEMARQAMQETVGVRADSPILFDTAHLHAFATGEVVEAFGPAYARYRGRRIPRLPNGDLLCVSRVLRIDGIPGAVVPGAALLSEFDVPAEAWFFREHSMLPLSILMESALQPCGILSTYLGTILPYPEEDFYFRNLDGEGELLRQVNVRGKSLTNQVRLLSSTALPGIILQKYGFALACEGKVFYRGTASFGYFTAEALQRQSGLDGGKVRCPWLTAALDDAGPLFPHPVEPARNGHFDLADKVWCVPGGGLFGQGYVYAEVPVSPTAWFFECHFYQDPVMPGSLGLEAMRQALEIYARTQGLTTGRLYPGPGRTVWKYRGQVPPAPTRLSLEMHIRTHTRTPHGITLVADGSLWRDNLRIYEVHELTVSGDE